MQRENEVPSLVIVCWQELQRLRQSAAALKNACATNEGFLTGAVASASWASSSAYADRPHPHSQSWWQKAGQARDLAYRVTVANAKPGLLEIADTYDGCRTTELDLRSLRSGSPSFENVGARRVANWRIACLGCTHRRRRNKFVRAGPQPLHPLRPPGPLHRLVSVAANYPGRCKDRDVSMWRRGRLGSCGPAPTRCRHCARRS